MLSKKISVLLAALTTVGRLALGQTKADSYGTSFIFVIPWNNGDKTEPPQGSVDIINIGSEMTNVTLQYTQIDPETGTSKQNITNLTIQSGKFTKFQFENCSIFTDVSKQQFVNYNDSRIFIEATQPVSILAHDYLPNGAGDSFTLLPTAMAGSRYAISLPSPGANGINVVYILPVNITNKLNVNVTAVNSTDTYEESVEITTSIPYNLYAYQSKEAVSLFIKSDQNFVVVAAVQHLSISPDSSNIKDDFGCFMPIPISDIDCGTSAKQTFDSHIALLLFNEYFMITETSPQCLTYNLEYFGGSGRTANETGQVSIAEQLFSIAQWGGNIGLQSKDSLVQMLQYGGYNASLSSLFWKTAFLDLIPAWSQYVTGNTSFIVPTNENIITLIGDYQTTEDARLDSSSHIWTWVPLPYFDGNVNYATTSLPAGLHTVSSTGTYTVLIRGTNGASAYGFNAAFNRQQVIPQSSPATPAPTQTPITTTAPDVYPTSYGTEFVTIFPWNNGDMLHPPDISMDIMNLNSVSATVNIDYRQPQNDGSEYVWVNKTITVSAVSSYTFVFNNSVAVYTALKDGLYDVPNQCVKITSSIPISIVQHNYMPGGSGDSFTVLPVSAAGTNYSLVLPASGNNGTSAVYFIGFSQISTLTAYVYIKGQGVQTFELNVGPSPSGIPIYQYHDAFSFYIYGNKPFAVIAAVRSLPTSSTDDTSTDFGCFMPVPYFFTDDSEDGLEDTHLTMLTQAEYFMINKAWYPLLNLSVPINGSSGKTEISVTGEWQAMDVINLNSSIFGNNIGAHPSGYLIHMLKYGGYNFGGTTNSYGAFLDWVPAVSQVVTGRIGFVAPPSNEITIFGDKKASQLTLVDNFEIWPWAPVPYTGGLMYYTTGSLQAGFHTVFSNGAYIVSVSGSHNGSAYGFVPAFNQPMLIMPIIPAPTLFPPTVSPIETTAESIATEFVVLFPWNNGDQNTPPKISVSLINVNRLPASVTIRTAENAIHQLSISGSSAEKFEFNSSVANYCSGEGFVQCPDTRVYISSTLPISVIANNFLTNVSGDSFSVMPTTMANKNYLLTLPKLDAKGFSTVYFVPLEDNVTVDVLVTNYFARPLHQQSFNISASENSVFAYRTQNPELFFASGNGNYVIILGAQYLPVMINSQLVEGHSDFGAFMPTPTLQTVCPGDYIDYHLSMLLQSRYFYVLVPQPDCLAIFSVIGASGKNWPYLGESRVKIDESYGNNAGFQSNSSLLQIIRHGGFGAERYGAFLDLDVSWSQFVSGVVGFVVPSATNEVTIIADANAMDTLKLDDAYISTWSPISYFSGSFGYAVTSVEAGFHVIWANGNYTVFVSGYENGAAYGYVVAYNAQIPNVPLPQPPTTLRPPSSSTSSSAAVTTTTGTGSTSSTTSTATRSTSTTTGIISTSTGTTSAATRSTSTTTEIISTSTGTTSTATRSTSTTTGIISTSTGTTSAATRSTSTTTEIISTSTGTTSAATRSTSTTTGIISTSTGTTSAATRSTSTTTEIISTSTGTTSAATRSTSTTTGIISTSGTSSAATETTSAAAETTSITTATPKGSATVSPALGLPLSLILLWLTH